ncbi:MAG TPA: site-2 protease family protein [Thermoanaerobaculia bacterium]|jgi:membrane-associated protease RseP (regulator of RpoE activity)|nr:site-2 protease family protein [Thermoanaerobaculia bacterium]
MSDGQPGMPHSSPLIELLPAPGNVYAPAPLRPDRPRYGRAMVLFALTFLSTTTLSPVMYLLSRTDVTTDLGTEAGAILTLRVVATVWGNWELLKIGLAFSIPALFILLCHELGHYIACRFYGIPCTPPYFLPVPANFGTFGAFIRIKAPIQSKRQLFDVGIAGPIAGFVALIPFLLYGIAKSQPSTQAGTGTMGLLLPGRCLAIQLTAWLFHGRLAAGTILNLHPTALAAWLGLFATSLNLLPLGQLDGGHILYAATGRLQWRLALPFWIALALLGFYWPGWLLWSLIVLVIGLRHPPVHDENLPLDRKRQALAWIALVMFVLSFMPVPLDLVPY